MATYKELHGTDIEVRSSDPSNPVDGQLWYNTTTEELKGARQFIGNAWSTGGTVNTARRYLAGTPSGTQTAALAFGGLSTAATGETESYNGTSWTEVNDLSNARQQLGGAGTQTSALAFGGGPPQVDYTELWNGTN